MGLRVSGDLTVRLESRRARLHGRDSSLTLDFDSLLFIRELHRQIPRPILAGRLPGSEPLTIVVRVRGVRVATVTMQDGSLTIRRHWIGMVRSLFASPHAS